MHISFSHHEIRDLLKAWLLTSAAFAIAFTGLSAALLVTIPLALLTAGVGIILHELMHKVMAARYGYHSEFRSFDMNLVIGVVVAVLGFVFIAPGAVFFAAHDLDVTKNGIISIAGPLTNIVLALLFLPVVLWAGVLALPSILGGIAMYGFMVNAWLGLFNMIPFFGLDGMKVLAWKPAVFWPTIIFGAILVFAGYVLF